MTRETEFFQAEGAAYWATYLINGDASGLTGHEQRLADRWLKMHGALDAVDCGEPYFSWSYGLYTYTNTAGGDLATYTLRARE